MTSAEQRIAELQEINRGRALTPVEVKMLAEAILRQHRGSARRTRPWTRRDDLALKRAMKARRFSVRDFAAKAGRTERAVWRRIWKLKKIDQLQRAIRQAENRGQADRLREQLAALRSGRAMYASNGSIYGCERRR